MLQVDHFRVFKNQDKGDFTIEFKENELQQAEVEIINKQGSVVFHQTSSIDDKKLPLKFNGASGVYLLQLRMGKKVYFSKLVIQ